MKYKVLEIIKTVSDINFDINDENSFNLKLRDDLNLDSLKLAVIAVKIEDQFATDVFKDSFPITINDIITKLV